MVKVLPHFPPFVFGLLHVLKCAISPPTTKQNQVDQKEVDKKFHVNPFGWHFLCMFFKH